MIDTKFASRWRRYLLQTTGATAYLAVAILVVNGVANLAVVSAIAASAFLVFCIPRSPMAGPWHLAGGHIVAVLVAFALSPLSYPPPWAFLDNEAATSIVAAICVGLTMLVMAVTNTEHAPATGTALGLSMQPWQWDAAASILIMVALLMVVQVAGRGRLVNLL